MRMLTTNISDIFACPPVVKKLMGFKTTSTLAPSQENLTSLDKLCEKAIRALVKKLKKTPGALEELEKAITNRDPNTKCITIPLKSSPLQQQERVSRKALPHVVYCRIWRYADLQNCNELKSLPHCCHGYTHASGKRPDSAVICINPNHYARCELASGVPKRPVSPPLVVYLPRSNRDSQMIVDQPSNDTSQKLPTFNFVTQSGQSNSCQSSNPSFSPSSTVSLPAFATQSNTNPSPTTMDAYHRMSPFLSEDDTLGLMDHIPQYTNQTRGN